MDTTNTTTLAVRHDRHAVINVQISPGNTAAEFAERYMGLLMGWRIFASLNDQEVAVMGVFTAFVKGSGIVDENEVGKVAQHAGVTADEYQHAVQSLVDRELVEVSDEQVRLLMPLGELIPLHRGQRFDVNARFDRLTSRRIMKWHHDITAIAERSFGNDDDKNVRTNYRLRRAAKAIILDKLLHAPIPRKIYLDDETGPE